MKEKVRFVWEGKIYTDIPTARKERVYESMKKRYDRIVEAINTLMNIAEVGKQAEAYGVLEVDIRYYGYDVSLKDGVLAFNVKSIAETTKTDREEIENKIKEGWKSFITELIEFEQKQKEQMETYLKEAEPYLTVSLTEDEDED